MDYTNLIIAMFVSAFFTFIIPIVLLIILGVKRKIRGLPLLFGALAFFISQICIRIPILSWLGTQQWFLDFSTNFFIIYVLMLSFTAGLFEESARLGGAALLKNHRTYKDIISFGLGHGLCEAVILVGLNMFASAFVAMNIENPLLIASLPEETYQTLLSQLDSIVPSTIYLSVVERVSAVIFHVFATVLVFKGVIKKQARYYLLALMYHTVFDFVFVLLLESTNMYITEALLFITALGMGYYTIRQKKVMTQQIETPEIETSEIEISEIEISEIETLEIETLQDETPQNDTPQDETPQND